MNERVCLRFQRRPHALLYSALLICILSFSASAQTDPTRNTIQGDIITPNGQRLDHPVMVWLSTSRGELSTTSNGNGSFVFRQLGGGRFVVKVDAGEAYEPATEEVNLTDSGSAGTMTRIGQIYSVQIHLRPKFSASITKGVISANHPPKAAPRPYNKGLWPV